MAPVLVILGRVAVGALVGYGAKRAVEAYNKAERRKAAAKAAENVRQAEAEHRQGLETVEEEFGDRLDEFTRRRLEKAMKEMES